MFSGKKQIAILLWLITIYIIGILIFTKGFLLKRVVVNNNSSCDVDFSLNTDDHEEEGCWMHKRFKKAVIIINDALKYDFLKFDESYKLNDTVPHFKNKLPFIQHLLHRSPKNSMLSKFMADPPTTTLQRLKGLTTGSLPTFVDAGSNFASSEIIEDNIIDQMITAGKKIKFLGDDTWLGLYPGRFFKKFPFPSFNVKDLHTVDNGILKHLLPELKLKDWDVFIAHFLGVDHCGHRFGPNHPAMSEKLLQMNSMIRNVTKVLDKDTVLFVFGDHGMTRTGDHGGDSTDELEAGLFIYSPEILTATMPKMDTRVLAQTDLVPTLSLLLGVPIPYSNLGMAIPELFNHCPWSKTATSEMRQVYHVIKALRLNAHQVKQFLKSYYEISTEFPQQTYKELENLFEHAESDLQKLLTAMVTDGETGSVLTKMIKLRDHYEKYIEGSREMCQKIWAKFDLVSISLGLIVMFLSILINLYFYLAHKNEESISPISVSVMIASSVIVGYAFLQAFYIGDFMNPFMVYLFSLVLIVTFLILIKKNINLKEKSKGDRQATFKLPSFDNIIATFILFCYTAGYFSNSFVVFEDTVTLFFAQSLIWLYGIKTYLSNNRNTKDQKFETTFGRHKKQKFDIFEKLSHSNFIILYVLLTCSLLFRLLTNFRVCREEQMPCNETMFVQPLTNFTQEESGLKNVRYFVSTACLGMFVYMSRVWMKHYGNLNGDTATVLCAKYLLPFATVCVGLHWAIQALPPVVLDSLPGWQQVMMAQIVYISIISLIICILINPLCLYVLYVHRDNPLSVPNMAISSPQIIPQVFNQLKEQLSSNGQAKYERPPVVYGMGTVYTTSVLYVVTTIGVLLFLLLGDGLSPSILLASVSVFLFIEIYSADVSNGAKDSDVTTVNWSAVVTLGMMTSHFFYGTGHQATIPSLQWNAAFTGFYGDFNNNILPALLMIFNTFASNIFMGLVCPLLVFWPKLYTRLNSLMCKKTHNKEKGKWRGDFVFFDDGEKLRQIFYQLSLAVLLFSSIKLFGAMGAAGLHRRHLMVWKIFAPRFIFEAVGTIVSFTVSFLMYLFVMRVDNSLSKFVKQF
ncbi:hypothetical protein SNE40_011734 [Patella caerulea]|uniref:GPI ethanolamine phosphate transferase 3, catalytic subunit n=1 Tax=Patella caerulea TaxID=87958 RepID=A0AAN8PUK6_PATCE